VGVPVYNPEILALGKQLAQSLDWVGPAGIEFKIHAETKKPMLLEINPRMWGYSWLATECGVNFPQIMVDYLLGRPVKERHEYPLDRVFMRGYRDVVMGNSRIVGAPK